MWREGRATAAIAAVTVLVSALLILSGTLPTAAVGWGFIPLRFEGAPPPGHLFMAPLWLTPLSATLIHGGWMHLGFNILMFVYCGQQTERVLGAGGIAVLYLIGAYAAAAVQWSFEPLSAQPMIGASGAISAIIGAYAILFGQRRAKRLGPIPAYIMHVAWLAASWIGIQLLIGLAGMGGVSVAIGAHIGGFVAGVLLARPLLGWRYRRA